MDDERPRLPNFYITSGNYDTLIGHGLWGINDVPPDRWAAVKDHLGKVETVAVFASGVAPREFSGREDRVAGIDWVKLERHPKAGEPPLNVYHYRIASPDKHGYPVFGPYISGSIAPHWAKLEDLDVYLGFSDPNTGAAEPDSGSATRGGLGLTEQRVENPRDPERPPT